jgi:hypothetical protein
VNGVVVMFGGERPPGWEYFNDTWTYNVSTNKWVLMKPKSHPIERQAAGATFCPPIGEVLIYGGYRHWTKYSEGGNYSEWEWRDDLWGYNASANTWKEHASSGPKNLQPPSMVYDGISGLVILLGTSKTGMDCYDPARDEWDSRPVSSGPLGSGSLAVTYDVRIGEIVLFGEPNEADNMPADTWTYNSTKNLWTPKDKRIFPLSISHFSMAYDDRDGVAAVLGAWGAIFMYNASTDRWLRANYTETSPFSRWDAALVYDSREGVFVMFSGVYGENDVFNDTRTYNVTTDNWTLKHPALSPPDGRGFSAVYDSDRGKVLLFGGRKGWNHYRDTWEYDTAADSWTRLAPAVSPPARDGAGMIYDSTKRVAVLFGGNGNSGTLNDTWLYDPAANLWTQCFPPVAPPARTEFGFAFDQRRGEAVLFGGMNGYPPLSDTWAFNVSERQWSRLELPFSPAPRFGHQMIYDTANSVFVLYGGTDLSIEFPEVWLLDLEGTSSSGSYVSEPFDTGGRAFFGALEWKATLPAGTSARFQLRTCATRAGLDGRAFTGPDGTPSSYYATSGHRISAGHDGSRYVQYRAILTSSNRFASPSVAGVTVNFNLAHSVGVQAPSAGAAWSGFRRVLWTVSDPDNDRIMVDVVLVGPGGSSVIAAGLPATDGNWLWNTSTVPNGTYRIQVVARDGNPDIPLEFNETTGEFSLFNAPPEQPAGSNHPPRLKGAPPSSAFVGEELRFRVAASDEDGDRLVYALAAGPAGMKLDAVSGDLTWTPAKDQVGSQAVVLRATDPKGGSADLTCSIRVFLRPPSCSIISPVSGAVLAGRAVLAGNAFGGSLPLARVEVRIDGGDWKNASGTSNWTLTLDTRELGNGPHRLEARSTDDSISSEPVFVEFTVRDQERAGSSATISGMTVGLLVLAMLAGLFVFGRSRAR